MFETFETVQKKVQKTANSLGYQLTVNRVEDIAHKVMTSPDVYLQSSQIEPNALLSRIIGCLLSSSIFFGLGAIYPTLINSFSNQSEDSLNYREQSVDANIASGYVFFKGSLLIFLIFEIQFIMCTIYREDKATQKMILYFLQKKVDISN